MRVQWIFGVVLAVSGIAPAVAAVPDTLNLPLPTSPRISVPVPKPVDFLSSDTILLTKDLHIEVAPQLLAGPLRLADAHAARAPAGTLPLVEPGKAATATALEWDFSKWGSLGLATETGEGLSTLLGDFTPRPLSFGEPETISAAGLSAHVKFGDGWVTTFSYSADVRQLDLRAGASPVLSERSARGQSLGFSIARHGVFDDADALGLSVTRPSDEYFGSITLPDAGLDTGGSLVSRYGGAAFSSAKETDVALGYVTSFFHGALSLQANAGYQMNANGQNGANSVTVLSRAKINF